jgi:peptidoglycan/xylan/chitin deacetylase (PgdA/CDA1 family)
MIRMLAALLLVLATAGVSPPHTAALGVPVLMYHRVDAVTPSDPVGRSLTLAPEAFEAQLAWLREHHIRTLTMNELADDLAAGQTPANAVVLTFDDGYTDAATTVTPLLVRYGAKASFYVSAGFIGDGRHASWKQLRAMQAAGMEIGCHGTRHRDLAHIGAHAAAYEVGHCRDQLERYLRRPTTYAYAAGKWNDAVIAIVRADGFKAALTERPGAVLTFDDPYALPRRRIDRGIGLDGFAQLATP